MKDYIALILMGLLLFISGLLDIFAFHKDTWGAWLIVFGGLLVMLGKYGQWRVARR